MTNKLFFFQYNLKLLKETLRTSSSRSIEISLVSGEKGTPILGPSVYKASEQRRILRHRRLIASLLLPAEDNTARYDYCQLLWRQNR